MFGFLGRILKWVFSRAFLVTMLWVLVVAGAAGYLAYDHYFRQMPAARDAKRAEYEGLKQQLEALQREKDELADSFREKAEILGTSIQSTRTSWEKSVRRAAELREAVASLSGGINKIRGAFDPSVTKRIREKAREREAEERKARQLLTDIKGLNKQAEALSQDREAGVGEMAGRESTLEVQVKGTGAEVEELDRNVNTWQGRFERTLYWLRRGLELVFWSLLVATVLLLVAPVVVKTILYFLWAPLIGKARAVDLDRGERAPPPINVSKAEVASEIELGPGDFAIVKPKFFQASDEALVKRTKFVFDWKYPVTSLACGLIELTRVTNDGEGSEIQSITLSSQNDAEIEITMVDLPEGATIVCRPSFLAGWVGNEGNRPVIRTHWRFFSLHAWITFQFRYFEFHGPGKLALWARRGVRAEILESGSERKRRTNQDATVGFTPTLSYSSARAETFWSFFRNENPLFDDLFSGSGVFLCQQIPGGGPGAKARKFWSSVWNGLMKVFGI